MAPNSERMYTMSTAAHACQPVARSSCTAPSVQSGVRSILTTHHTRIALITWSQFLLTALSETYRQAASYFWVMPFSLRSCARKLPKAILFSSYIVLSSL